MDVRPAPRVVAGAAVPAGADRPCDGGSEGPRLDLGGIRRITDPAAEPDAAGPLLCDVHRLVRDQLAAGRRLWRVTARAEEDVRAGGEGLRLQRAGKRGGGGVGVHPHVAEIGAQVLLHRDPQVIGQRRAAAALRVDPPRDVRGEGAAAGRGVEQAGDRPVAEVRQPGGRLGPGLLGAQHPAHRPVAELHGRTGALPGTVVARVARRGRRSPSLGQAAGIRSSGHGHPLVSGTLPPPARPVQVCRATRSGSRSPERRWARAITPWPTGSSLANGHGVG